MTRRQILILVATSAAALMIGMDLNGAASVVTPIEGSFDSD